MPRPHLPKKIETKILVSSRRRCCICFGTQRDTHMKAGQIAHLDQDASNNSEDNLAFLCLVHHDEYDSRTSQSKGLTIDEVKHFKAETLAWIACFLEERLSPDHNPPVPADAGAREDDYAGLWLRIGHDDSPAEIQVVPLPQTMEGDFRYFVYGLGFDGISNDHGSSVGEFDFYSIVTWVIEGGRLKYTLGGNVLMTVTFTNDGHVLVTENSKLTPYSDDVSFAGTYYRSKSSDVDTADLPC